MRWWPLSSGGFTSAMTRTMATVLRAWRIMLVWRRMWVVAVERRRRRRAPQLLPCPPWLRSVPIDRSTAR
uniref:Putative secreted peptide n=1 Tax=Anopheles braziliensis TaxID=58242 RepID=A0A2M3ZV96_9DIPT